MKLKADPSGKPAENLRVPAKRNQGVKLPKTASTLNLIISVCKKPGSSSKEGVPSATDKAREQQGKPLNTKGIENMPDDNPPLPKLGMALRAIENAFATEKTAAAGEAQRAVRMATKMHDRALRGKSPLHAAATSTLGPAAVGAGIGALVGKKDKDGKKDRVGGALRGALVGGGIGAASGAAMHPKVRGKIKDLASSVTSKAKANPTVKKTVEKVKSSPAAEKAKTYVQTQKEKFDKIITERKARGQAKSMKHDKAVRKGQNAADAHASPAEIARAAEGVVGKTKTKTKGNKVRKKVNVRGGRSK